MVAWAWSEDMAVTAGSMVDPGVLGFGIGMGCLARTDDVGYS